MLESDSLNQKSINSYENNIMQNGGNDNNKLKRLFNCYILSLNQNGGKDNKLSSIIKKKLDKKLKNYYIGEGGVDPLTTGVFLGVGFIVTHIIGTTVNDILKLIAETDKIGDNLTKEQKNMMLKTEIPRILQNNFINLPNGIIHLPQNIINLIYESKQIQKNDQSDQRVEDIIKIIEKDKNQDNIKKNLIEYFYKLFNLFPQQSQQSSQQSSSQPPIPIPPPRAPPPQVPPRAQQSQQSTSQTPTPPPRAPPRVRARAQSSPPLTQPTSPLTQPTPQSYQQLPQLASPSARAQSQSSALQFTSSPYHQPKYNLLKSQHSQSSPRLFTSPLLRSQSSQLFTSPPLLRTQSLPPKQYGIVTV